MSDWAIIFGTGTVNQIPNPSFEINTNGYIAKGSSILSRQAGFQSRGAWGLQITPSAGVNDGVVFTGTSLTAGRTYNASVDMYLPTGTVYRLYFADVGNVQLGTPTAITGSNTWQRPNVSWLETGTTVRRLVVDKNNSASTSPFYTDGWQIENGPATSYCDGDQDECSWNADIHNSTSTRINTATRGGIELDLFDTFNFKPVDSFGIGAPTIQNLSSPYATQPGAYYQGNKVNERLLNLIGVMIGTGKQDLHNKRNLLLRLLRMNDQKPIRLKYKVPGRPVLIDCVYDSGLEFGETDGFTQRMALRLIAYGNPFWKEEFQQGAQLSAQNTLPGANCVVLRDTDGQWKTLVSGTNAQVMGIGEGLDGTLYFGGFMTGSIDGIASSKNVVRYRNGAWANMGTGVTSGSLGSIYVKAFCTLPDGNIAVGGYYAVMDNVQQSRLVTRWNPNTNSFDNYFYTTGTYSGGVEDMCLDKDGNLVAVGSFLFNYGPTVLTRAMRYNFVTRAWSAMGSSPQNFNAVKLGPDNNIYAVSDNNVCKWNDNTNTWDMVGSGTANTLYAMSFDRAGNLYVGGVAGSLGGVPFNFFGFYNGYVWQSPVGINNRVYAMDYDRQNNLLYMGGLMTGTTTVNLPDKVVTYNGSVFAPLDIDLPGSAQVLALKVTRDNRIVLGYDLTGIANHAYAGVKQSVGNAGTALIYPVITFYNTGTAGVNLYSLTNLDTGKSLYFNLTINSQERLTLDFRPNKKTFTSNQRGNMLSRIAAGSDLMTWALTNPTPQIRVFANGSIECSIYWDVSHLSADGR